MPNIKIKSQYIKDLSFEIPHAPAIFNEDISKSEIKLNIDINANKISENNYEVTLSINCFAELGNDKKKTFICDLIYAGIFELIDFEKQAVEEALLIYCPNILFPYLRRVVTTTTIDAGLPPLMLEPIDFFTLYQNKKNSQGEENKKAN